MLSPGGLVASSRSWIPLVLRPYKCFRDLAEAIITYEPSAAPMLELFDAGIKLGREILLPAILLGLIGSLLPSTPTNDAIDLPPCVDALSPYTRHSSAISFVPKLSNAATINRALFPSHDAVYLLRLVAASLVSPTTADVMFHRIRPLLVKVVSRVRVFFAMRKRSDDRAMSTLLQRVKDGRAIRRHAYDLYLPPKSTVATESNSIKSLLLFPGMAVPSSGYADVAARISDHGIPVAVVSLEPFRFAHKCLGGSMNDVRRVMRSAGSVVAKYCKENVGSSSKHMDELSIEWALGGHSLGGYNALQLAEELITHEEVPSVPLRDGSISRVSPQIVVLGAGNNIAAVPDLRNGGSSQPLRVLVLLASNDVINCFSSRQQKHEFLSKMPRGTRMLTIKGGNHSGFATYKSGPYDGVREIPLEVQHEETARRTANFILSNNKLN